MYLYMHTQIPGGDEDVAGDDEYPGLYPRRGGGRDKIGERKAFDFS